VYAALFIGFGMSQAGDTFGFGRSWSRLKFVKKHSLLV
jgi:hypothetical protein